MIQKIRRDKKGVSPVIGVILMVAATIVIAAVVIAMLGGFGPPARSYAIGVSASQTGDTISVLFNGGPDQAEVVNLSFYGTDSEDNPLTWACTPIVGGGGSWNEPTLDDPIVGDEATATGTAGKDRVIVVATFGADIQQVILDTYV